MTKNHLKRITSPRTWKFSKKKPVFVTKPQPGAHTQEFCVSINTFLKEMVGLVKTTKETNYLLKHDEVLINGARKYSKKHQVGFLDVVSLPKHKIHYRLTVGKHGYLRPKKIDAKEADKIILRISNKTPVKGGDIQINTSSGRNITVKSKKAEKYGVGDSLFATLDNDIKDHIERKEGVQVFIYKGQHAGKTGVLKELMNVTVKVESAGEILETRKEYIIVTGDKKPKIKLEVENE